MLAFTRVHEPELSNTGLQIYSSTSPECFSSLPESIQPTSQIETQLGPMGRMMFPFGKDMIQHILSSLCCDL